MRKEWIASFALLYVAAVSGTEMSEYKVKALFLYNFAQFVEWPPSAFKDAAAPLTLCVLGPNPFDNELERTVAGKQVGGRPLVVRQVPDSRQAGGCHILFVSAGVSKRARTLLSELAPAGILTVGEVDGFASSGGVINFKLKDGSVRLEINVHAAEKEGLHISSKLLSLAEIIK